eukprot:g5638.t1
MQAPYSGESVRSGGAAEPITTERLEEVKRHLATRKHWPAFLHGGWANGCPEDVEDALAWMASGTVRLLDMASVGPLVPICKAFKGLIQAAEGAAEADAHLRELIAWCAFILTEVLLRHGKEVDAHAPVMKPLRDFESVTDDLAKRAKRLATRRKCTALLCFSRDGKQIQEFDVKLRNIWNDIQGVTIMEVELRDARPPKLGEMAQIPQEAPDVPPAFVERSELVDAVVQDLVAMDRAANKAHVLRGIPGGGKTVAASAVVRSKPVRRSFKAGVFWVGVGQVGTGNPTPLLKGLAEHLAHAPSNRPRAVPHEFRDAEHVISHLVGVLEQGSLRCLVVLDDVWDPEIVPLFLRTGFHCLVTTRDVAVVPRHLRGTCTPVDMLTETEALELLKNASRATASIPRDEGLKVAGDCGFLPLAVAIIGAMGSSRVNPHSPETWRDVHTRLVEEPTLVQDHVGGALAVSFRELNEKVRARFRKLGVLARGVRAPVDMVAHLWDQDPSDTTLLLSDLVDKSLLKVVEQSYYLHDLVLDFAKDELRKLGRRVQLVTCRQAQFLGTISVLEGYARAGESLRGFYALMALWASVEDLSGDQQLAVGTGSSRKGKLDEADPLLVRAIEIQERALGPDHPELAVSLRNRGRLFRAQGKLDEADPLLGRAIEIQERALGSSLATSPWALGLEDQACSFTISRSDLVLLEPESGEQSDEKVLKEARDFGHAEEASSAQENGDAGVNLSDKCDVARPSGPAASEDRVGGMVEPNLERVSTATPHALPRHDMARRPPIRQVWLSSCGDINPGETTTPPTEGALLSLHSVNRRVLHPAGDGSTRILHSPPGEISGHGVLSLRWRDKYGQVEIKAAPQDRNHVEEVRLLDDVFMVQVYQRQETGTCLITPVLQGPAGATFAHGTASISYYLGRYDLLVLSMGEKGGKGGMESYIRDTYFAVEKADGADQQWKADSASKEIVWKGDEIWLEFELQHFCWRGLAAKWDRFKSNASRRGSAATSTTATSSSTTTSSAHSQDGGRVSRTPLGSSEYPEIEVVNETEECLTVMLIPETILTAQARAKSQAAGLSFQIAGQGISVDGSKETSDSLSQQPTYVYSTPTWKTIPKGEKSLLELPGGKRCRILWCSISERFKPEDLPIDQGTKNPVNEDELESHGSARVIEWLPTKLPLGPVKRTDPDGTITARLKRRRRKTKDQGIASALLT